MNQSIFIAENNLSSCPVCAHRTLLQAHPEALLVLNVGEVSVNMSGGDGEVTERGLTPIKRRQDTSGKGMG